MRQINSFIIEKLKINKDIEINIDISEEIDIIKKTLESDKFNFHIVKYDDKTNIFTIEYTNLSYSKQRKWLYVQVENDKLLIPKDINADYYMFIYNNIYKDISSADKCIYLINSNIYNNDFINSDYNIKELLNNCEFMIQIK